MKAKIFYPVAMATLMLVSCSEQEVLNTQSSPEPIGFGTFIGATRAGTVNLDSVKESGFKVLAYSTGVTAWATAEATAAPDFMYDQTVAWNTDHWEYSPVQYWPDSQNAAGDLGMLTFCAYNSVTGAAVSDQTTAGTPTITFTCQQNAVDQVDLVVDMLVDQTKETNSCVVNLAFDHILSRVGFTAQLAAQYLGATITVTSLKVYYDLDKVKSNGVYTFATDNTPGSIWSDPATVTYMESKAEEDGDDLIKSGGAVVDNSAVPVPTPLSAADKLLLLIPQTIELGDIYARIEFTVESGGPLITNTEFVMFPAATFLPGQQYVYNFGLTLEGVEFDDITIL